MATLTATTRTRKSGPVTVIQAHNNNGDKITETTCATFGCDYLVVNLWYRPSGSRVIIGIQGNVIDTAQKYTPTLTVRLRTNDVNSAEREFNHSSQGTRILKRHSDGTYSERGAACVSRNYPDRKWRIVCDPRPFEQQPTFKSRDEAAAAEWVLAHADKAAASVKAAQS